MFKLLKTIFSTSDTATKVVDGVMKGTDAAFFTAEEKSEWFLRYLESTLPMNLSRRVIAMSVAFVWVISALTLLVLTLIAGLSESLVVAKTAEAVYAFMSGVANLPFMTVMGFYFAKNLVPSIGNKEKK